MIEDWLAEHQDRAGALITGLKFDDAVGIARLRRDVLRTLSDERALSLCVVLVERASAHRGWDWGGSHLLTDLNRRALPWTARDVRLLSHLTRAAVQQTIITVLEAVASAGERLSPADQAGCVDQFRQALRLIDTGSHDPGERARLRLRFRVLLQSADPASAGAVRTGVFEVSDGWSQVAVERLLAVTTDVGGVSDVLAHAAAIAPGPRPTKTWLKRATDLLSGRPELVGLVRELLDLAHTCEPAETEMWGIRTRRQIGTNNVDLARGLMWMAATTGEPWLVAVVVAVYATRPEPKVLNTCVAVLGRRGDAAAIGALIRLQRTTRDRGELKQITNALDEAATFAGLSRSELTEQTISDAGLDSRRERRVTVGEVTARLALDDHAKVRLLWEHNGRATTKPPPIVEPGLIADLKRDAADLKKLVAAERDRLEDLIVEEREWPLATWRLRYVDHPVTGALASRLLWTVDDGDRRVAALPTSDGRFMLADGDIFRPGKASRIRVWHPVSADPEEVRAWRDHILARELAQPFKQAFREVYRLTPAEEETGVYSNRFAAHVLRYQQVYALMKERRWGTNYLGGWDGGGEGEGKREFAAHGLRAVFIHHAIEDEDGHHIPYCATDQVRFHRARGRNWESMALADVPPVVFSEAMRDVDLFVGVTSIATDPTWADRGAHPRFDYWRGTAFGDLSESGRTRRQVIEHLLPKLKIRDRARLDGNHLVVDGQKHTYRIHIGSANILMSPNDEYLCIVPARGSTKPAGVAFVPFEGDEVLALVLSKAFLLADDHRITDPSIVRQIG